MHDLPPSVSLPGHNPHAGLLLEWRQSPHGDWWALVYWTAELPGYKGGLDPRESWFHEDRVKQIGEGAKRLVPWTYAGPARP